MAVRVLVLEASGLREVDQGMVALPISDRNYHSIQSCPSYWQENTANKTTTIVYHMGGECLSPLFLTIFFLGVKYDRWGAVLWKWHCAPNLRCASLIYISLFS